MAGAENLKSDFEIINLEDSFALESDDSFEFINPADQREINLNSVKINNIIARNQTEIPLDSPSLLVEEDTISGFSQNKLTLMANFSKLCYFRNQEKAKTLEYAAKNAGLNANGFKTIDDLIKEGYEIIPFQNQYGEAGYLFCKGFEVTIAYRGTKTKRDMATDANCMFVTSSFIKDGGRVHSGFYHSFKSSWDDLYIKLDSYASQIGMEVKDLKINVTGHSMGGALAKIAALRLKTVTKVENVNVATFADPRAFDLTASEVYNEKLATKTLRVTQHRADPVPAVAPGSFGYCHVGAQLRVDVHKDHYPHQMDGYLKAVKNLKAEEYKSVNNVSLFYYPSKLLQYVNAYTLGTLQSWASLVKRSMLPSEKWIEDVLKERNSKATSISVRS